MLLAELSQFFSIKPVFQLFFNYFFFLKPINSDLNLQEFTFRSVWFCSLCADEESLDPSSAAYRLNSKADWSRLLWGGNQSKERKSPNSKTSLKRVGLRKDTPQLHSMWYLYDRNGLPGCTNEFLKCHHFV